MNGIKKYLAVCICLLLLGSCAIAEVITDFSGPGYDALQYACILPGRQLSGEPRQVALPESG